MSPDEFLEAEQELAFTFIKAMEDTYSMVDTDLLEYALEALLNTIINREDNDGLTH